MEEIKIRPFQENDSKQVIELNNSLKRSNKGDGPWNEDIRDVKRYYQDDKGEFLIAEINNKVIGMGGLKRIDNKTAEIKRMRISKDHQRKGIGSMLLKELEVIAKNKEYKRIILDTSLKQVSAQKLYEKKGYKKYKRKKLDGFDSILYEKQL